MAEEKSRDDRARIWTAILYPESAPENWRDILDEQHVPYAVSPLHDKDKNPTGEPKKPHWHIAFILEGKKSYTQMAAITASVKGTIPQKVESARGLVRYLAHMDNPEKAQYDHHMIETHGGVDIADYIVCTKADSRRILKEILEYIVKEDITEYEDILLYAMYNDDDWFDALRTECTYVVNAFVKSRRHRRDEERAKAASGTGITKEEANAFNERHPEG